MKLRPCLLLCVTIALTLLPVFAADPPDKGKGKGGPSHIFVKVKSGDQKWEVTPNVLGNFSRFFTKTNTPVEVEIHYPQAYVGDLAVMAIRDAGNLTAQVPDGGNGKGKGGTQTVSGRVIRAHITDNRKLVFTFNYGTEFHRQRVSVQAGGTRTTFEFCVDH